MLPPAGSGQEVTSGTCYRTCTHSCYHLKPLKNKGDSVVVTSGTSKSICRCYISKTHAKNAPARAYIHAYRNLLALVPPTCYQEETDAERTRYREMDEREN